jgi:hypothetical protein
MQECPNDSNETSFCLTRDDLGLRVTIFHIRRSQFGTGAHILLSIGDDRFRVNSAIAKLPNPKLTSLLMHCVHCKLTCLSSQALFQAALDKEASILPGWLLLREFLGLPVNKRAISARQPPEEAVQRLHRERQYCTRGIKTNQDQRATRFMAIMLSYHPFERWCQQLWLLF